MSQEEEQGHGLFRRYKWVLLITSVWAARVAFVALSLAIPLLVEVYYEISARITYGNPSSEILSVPWTHDLLPLLDAETELFPKLIRGAPVPSMGEYMFYLSELSPAAGAVKVRSDSGLFVYHASDRAWCKSLDLPPADHQTVPMALELVSKHVYGGGDASVPPYYYMSYEIYNTISNPFVYNTAPYLLRLGGRAAVPPQMRLWISSPSATASWHYDMESNFFVQLTGSKTFLLANADAYLFLSPQSYLHPMWRQSMHFNLTSLEAIAALAVSYVDTFGHMNCTAREMASQNHHRQNPICVYKKKIKAEPARSKTGIAAEVFGLTAVTLTAGDVLHLPPFSFHCVISRQDSSSLNAWLGSPELTISNKLLNAPLPFPESASLSEQLQAVRYQLMRLFSIFGYSGVYGLEYQLFSTSFAKRYSYLALDEERNCQRSNRETCAAGTCSLDSEPDWASLCNWETTIHDMEKIQTGK